MVAAILQLQSTGVQDATLTENPEVNILKYKYYRYVNFATEIVKLLPDDIVDFGKAATVTIPTYGHLLSKLFLRIKIPKLVRTSGTYLSWCETIGYAIFNGGIDLEVGGVIIDTCYPGFWDIYESFSKPDNDLGNNLLLLRGDTYISSRYNAEKSNELIIPLKFWFTRDYTMSLPLIAMSNQDIRLKFKFREFQECINYDGDAPIDNHITEAEFYAEYIFVDDVILPKYLEKTLYLIEQVRYNGIEFINANVGSFQCQLEFSNPCKELMFACVTLENIKSNNYFNYMNHNTDETIITEIGLLLNGKHRLPFVPEVFNRLAYASAAHSSVPLKYVYCIPFCINPQDAQPSGSLNLARFDSKSLSMKLVQNNPECYIFVYGVMYNVVEFYGGYLSLKFNI